MAYVPLSTVSDGNTITSAWGNQVKDNFAAGVPDIFTTKGDLAAASANDTAGRLAVGSNYQVLEALSTATLGVQYGSGVRSICWKNSFQSIVTGVLTKVQVATAISDVYSMLDTVNNRLVIPAGFPTREYVIFADGYWDSHATDRKIRHLEIRVNGVAQVRDTRMQDVDSEAIGMCCSKPYQLAAGDYIEAWVKQNSGGNLSFRDCFLSLAMIR